MTEKKLNMKQNMLWNTAGNFVYLVLQWLITIVIVRLTGYYEAGLYSLAMSVTNVCYSVASWGMRTYQVSDVTNKYKDLEYILSRIITCLIAFFSCVFFVFYHSYSVEQSAIILIYMIFRITEAFADVFHGVEQKNWRMDYIGKSFLIRGILIFFVFSVSLWLERNLLLSVCLLAVTSALVVVFYDIQNVKRFIGNQILFRYKYLGKLVKETLPLAIYILMSTAVASIPRYRLENLKGTDILGVYASIATPVVIIQAAASFLMAPITTPLAEYLEKKEKKKFFDLIRNTCLALLGVFLIAATGCHFIGEWGLALLFGEDILEYSFVLMPVVLCVIAVSISWFVNMILTVMRLFQGLIISNMIAMAITVFFSSRSIMHFGINGTSYITVLALFIQVIMGSLFILVKSRKCFKDER